MKPPSAIQFLLPLITTPRCGTNTSICRKSAPTSSGQEITAQDRGDIREARIISGTPIPANRACRQNTVNADPPPAIDSTLELDSTITRPKQVSATVAPSTR